MYVGCGGYFAGLVSALRLVRAYCRGIVVSATVASYAVAIYRTSTERLRTVQGHMSTNSDANGDSFAARLDHLFRKLPSASGGRWSVSEIARRSTDFGYPISEAYLYQLRSGVKENPSLRHTEGLARAFGVDIRFFTDRDVYERGVQEIDYLRLQSSPGIHAAAHRMVDLSETRLSEVIDFIRFMRIKEGLPADPGEGDEQR